MKKLLVLLVLLISRNAYSVAYHSNNTGGGLWSVGASWNPVGVPGDGDTVHILGPDTITIDGSITIGTGVNPDTTYEVDITGTLQWPQNPAADWVFTVKTSIQVQNGGHFIIGTSEVARLDCARTAYIRFANVAQDYDLIIADGGFINIYGCEGYRSSTGHVGRAMIATCSANPCIGAVTVTLDRDVNWDDCNHAWSVSHDTWCHLAIGTGGDPANNYGDPFPYTTAEEVTDYTRVAANQISLTLANAHRVGDFVFNNTRNVLFDSNGSVVNHAAIASLGGAMQMSWMRTNNLGELIYYLGVGSDFPAITFYNTARTMGKWSYISATNVSDDNGSSGFQLDTNYAVSGLTTNIIEDCYVYNVGSAAQGFGFIAGVNVNGQSYGTLIKDCGVIGDNNTVNSTGVGASQTHSISYMNIDGLWCSNIHTGVSSYASALRELKNSRIYGNDRSYYDYGAVGATFRLAPEINIIQDTVMRNSNRLIFITERGGVFILSGLDLDGAATICMTLNSSASAVVPHYEMFNSTFDACGYNNVFTNGAMYLSSVDIMKSAEVWMYGLSFGTSVANRAYNIRVNTTNALNSGSYSNFRLYCDECNFTNVTNPTWAPYDHTLSLDNGWTGIQYVTYLGFDSYLTLHNINGVAGAHEGWGPGGMRISHVTGAGPVPGWVDNTLNLKVTPMNGSGYQRVELGKISIRNGQTLTVNLQVQKDETQIAGNRPRLMLLGCGFDSLTDYDEMTDGINTWETLTVTGAANANGVVHIFLETMGKTVGNIYTFVYPPTMDVYADGISFTRS